MKDGLCAFNTFKFLYFDDSEMLAKVELYDSCCVSFEFDKWFPHV